MKGVFTLGIYVAIGITGAAFGQSRLEQASTYVKDVPADAASGYTGYFPSLKALAMPPSPPGWTPATITPAPVPKPERRVPDVVVIKFGNGGRVDEHRQRFADYRPSKTKVEIRGPCYSACTLLLSYVEADDLCIAPGGFMAFHAIRSMEKGERMNYETWQAYLGMPSVIKMWIDDNGGHENLPLNGYWTLYDRQMWAMGYAECK